MTLNLQTALATIAQSTAATASTSTAATATTTTTATTAATGTPSAVTLSKQEQKALEVIVILYVFAWKMTTFKKTTF